MDFQRGDQKRRRVAETYDMDEQEIKARIKNSHKLSRAMSSRNVTYIKPNSWAVLSSNYDTIYLVEKISSGCLMHGCYKCKSCGICIHEYTCTCPDHVTRFNICKHIHLCVALPPPGMKFSYARWNCPSWDDDRGSEFSSSSETVDEGDAEVQRKLDLIAELYGKSRYSPEQVMLFNTYLDMAISTLSAASEVRNDGGHGTIKIKREIKKEIIRD